MGLVTSDNWLVKTAGPFVESGGEVIIRRHDLGWCPETVRTRHLFHLTGTTGGTVNLYGEGPGGGWTEIQTLMTEDDVVESLLPWSAFRATFTGTGGAGQLDVKGYVQGW